jgi:hypothetical protein
LAITPPDRLQTALEGAVAELVHEYRWAHELAYGLERSSDAKVRGGSRPDPTYSTLAGRASIRGKLHGASRKVTKALEILEEGRKQLLEGFEKASKPEPLEDVVPVSISNYERKEALAARARRNARGEGFGSA